MYPDATADSQRLVGSTWPVGPASAPGSTRATGAGRTALDRLVVEDLAGGAVVEPAERGAAARTRPPMPIACRRAPTTGDAARRSRRRRHRPHRRVHPDLPDAPMPAGTAPQRRRTHLDRVDRQR